MQENIFNCVTHNHFHTSFFQLSCEEKGDSNLLFFVSSVFFFLLSDCFFVSTFFLLRHIIVFCSNETVDVVKE